MRYNPMYARLLTLLGAVALLVTVFGCADRGLVNVDRPPESPALTQSLPTTSSGSAASVSRDASGSGSQFLVDESLPSAKPPPGRTTGHSELNGMPAIGQNSTHVPRTSPQDPATSVVPPIDAINRSHRPGAQSPVTTLVEGACTDTGPESEPCQSRDVSGFDLFSTRPHAAAGLAGEEGPTVEEILEAGLDLAGASPVHIALRGTAQADSVRCAWRGIARAPSQREETIRYWLQLDDDDPIPDVFLLETVFTLTMEMLDPHFRETAESNLLAIARGGVSDEYMYLTCYVDYSVNEYLLGDGPATISVAYDRLGEARSYELYVREHFTGQFGGNLLKSQEEYESSLQQILWDAESSMAAIVERHESVVFLAPMGAHNAIAIEAWQVVAQWDLQVDGDDATTVNAVQYGVPSYDPESSQTLTSLESRVGTAAVTDAFAGDRIENSDGLDDYYRDIGAYDDITPDDGDSTTFTPDDPPPIPTCAGVDAVDDPRLHPGLVSDCTILLDSMDALAGTASLNWNASTTVSAWEGITLNASSTRITALELSDDDLDGTLPAALGGLSALVTLDLSDNDLTGEIPAEFGRLWSLETVRLSGNGLTGCIPVALESVATSDLASLNLLYCSPPAPGDLSSGSQTENSVSLSWNPVSNTDMYRVEYRGGSAFDWTVDDTATSTSHTVTGLRCEVRYLFRVSAHGSGTRYAAAWGTPSELLSVTTGECVPPVFGSSSYSFAVAHDAPAGTVVGSVSATDSPGDTVSYSISAGDDDGAFTIEETNGEITLSNDVDDLTPTTTTLTVDAADLSGGTSEASVDVHVARPPSTLEAVPTGDHGFTVSWSAAPGATSYSLRHRRTTADGEEQVATTTSTSHVFHPDGGCAVTFEFSVSATVGDLESPYTDPVVEASCNLAPQFGLTSFSFSISEDASVGDVVDIFSATDAEGESLSYAIVAGNGEGHFALPGATSTQITVADLLDHESVSEYTLTVEATDGTYGTAEVDVTITVMDVNEAPVAAGDAAETDVDTAVVIAVLDNDTDEDAGDSLTVQSVTQPADGSATINIDGTVTYTPEVGFSGDDSFGYTVTDGSLSATATVSVTVRESCANGTVVADPDDNPGLVEDCTNLLEMRDTLAGAGALDWSADRAIAEWEGVTVDGAPGRVTELSIRGSDLNGRIPASLDRLTHLTSLTVDDHRLTGSIPSTLGSLTRLKFLSIDGRHLTGSIPSTLGSLTKLKFLSIRSDGLTGTIPSTLGSLADLKILSIRSDGLTGSIPSTLGSLPNLTNLTLSGDELTGPIPTELGSLTNLTSVQLHGDRLTGPIPTELGSLADLKILSIRSDGLTGSIPSTLGSLTDLTSLTLSVDGLTGSIPTELGDLVNLTWLHIRGDRLTGPIPASLGDLATLSRLSIRGSRLTGSIPAELGNLSILRSLDLSGNGLTGSIPARLGSLSSLTRLSISGDQLSGSIPSGLGSLSDLTSLQINGSRLTGSIPSELGGLSDLASLQINGSQLAGPIPAELGSLPDLRTLFLYDNRLTGPIPASLGNLSNLITLDISRNELTGGVPASLGGLANLRSLRLSGNRFTGCVPATLRSIGSSDIGSLHLPYCDSYAPAPGNLLASPSIPGAMELSWTSVPGAVRYRVEYRTAGATEWVIDDDAITGAGHTVDDLDCSTSHEFRVSAYGDGETYVSDWGVAAEVSAVVPCG